MIVTAMSQKINSSEQSGDKGQVASFNIIYSNLPLNERRLPIVVIDNQPISWEMASREINQKTPLGEQILEKLKKLEII